MSRTAFLGWSVLAMALAVSAPAGAADKQADQVKGKLSVAAQKMEADFRAALQAAGKEEKTDKAIAILKAIVGKLEDDTALTKERRDSFIKVAQGRLKALEAGPDAKVLNEKDVLATIQRHDKNKQDDKKLEEERKLQQNVNEVLQLQKEGRFLEARRLAGDLAKQNPGNPTVAAIANTTFAFDQLVSNRSIKADKDRGFDRVLREVEKSAMPPSGDIEFPKGDYAKRVAARQPIDKPKLSVREKAILDSLRRPVSVGFKGDKFSDVLEYLATVSGQPIFLDKDSLRDANIDYETPVTINVRNVTLRSVLRKILSDFGLTYVVKDEAIQVVTIEKARGMMSVRAYYMGDLLGVGGGPGDPLTNVFGPRVGQVQMVQSIASIIDMIQSIEPQSWQVNGGPGSVVFYYPTMSLMIKQSAEVHGIIGGSFYGR